MYSLYLTLVYSYFLKKKITIILLKHTMDQDYIFLKTEIENLNWVEKVIIIDDYRKKNKFLLYYPKVFFYKNQSSKELESLKKILIEKKYYDIYTSYDDTYFFSKFFSKEKYHLIEDGELTYQIIYKKGIKDVIRKIIFLRNGYARSKNIIDIIVLNEKRMREVSNKNIIDFEYNKKIKEIKKEDKIKIIDLFLKKGIEIKKGNDLLITQCFYQDGFLKNKNSEIEMYKELIKKYSSREKILYIKPHPRDIENVLKDLKDVIFLPKYFPFEILDLIYQKNDKIFNNVFTINSTVINNINICERKFKDEKLLEKYIKSEKKESIK